MPPRVFFPVLVLALLFLPFPAAATGWLDEVDLLISKGEREAFLRLASDPERQEFARRFWQVRDPYPKTARNELEESWHARLADARRRWGTLRDDRARVLLLRGEPDASFETRCGAAAPVELWIYEPGFQSRQRFLFLFTRTAEGPARLWQPGPQSGIPLPATLEGCSNPGMLAEAAKWLRLQGSERYLALVELGLARPKANPRDWYVQAGGGAGAPESALPAAALAADGPSVRLLPPYAEVLAGSVRFEARVEGPVRQVAFSLDGERIYTRTRPPYAVTLDLGAVPLQQKLLAEGLDERGEVVARDEMILNAGAQRFAVRLLEPLPGKAYPRGLRASVRVEAPEGETVERVELWLDETRVATLRQPPYALPVALPASGDAGYVRAVAYLKDGRTAEDVVVLGSAQAPEEMAVRLVDLYTTVLDPSGRPVQGLGPEAFAVLEDGVRQTPRLFERVEQAPIRVVSLIDNSLSMNDNLAEVRSAALQFFRRTLRPVDQAAVITFNSSPRLAVRLTGDLDELEEGLQGLLAEDRTALYDSLVYSFQYLTGVKGQRAILLLSDGVDRASRLDFAQTLEAARRAGVTVYAIGLALPDGGRGEAGKKLDILARETGGRSFLVGGTAELDRVYAEIERELRAQYHIAYQSTNTSPDEEFRAVKVELARKGLEARTISGYYP